MSHIEILRKYISDDVLPTFKDIKVVSYSIVSVLFIGAAGIWLPWISQNTPDVLLPGSTVFTYVLALLGSLVCNKLFFHSHKINEISHCKPTFDESASVRNDNQIRDFFERSAILSAWGILAGGFIIVLTAIVYSKSNDQDSWLGLIALISSWILYYLATATEVKKKTEVTTKGNQDAVPIFPPVIESDMVIDENFFQTGKD